MDNIKEFWKHNINPITGFVYDSKRESTAIKAHEDRRLGKLGIRVKKESFDAEYDFL